MASRTNSTFSFQVHGAGDRTLDGIFRLISIADQERSLEEVLTAMCGDVADIASADIVSIYVREDADEGVRFTMRGNVGFPAEAVGRVHLRPGEGITGFAADRMRPVSVAVGKRDAHFKYIPGLGEEKYPALLAVPIVRAAATTGVLVLQRSVARSFSEGEVVLATALAAVINHALERGEERERQAARLAERRAVRLPGRATVGGCSDGARRGAADAVRADARRVRRAAVGRQPGSDRRTAADGSAQGGRRSPPRSPPISCAACR